MGHHYTDDVLSRPWAHPLDLFCGDLVKQATLGVHTSEAKWAGEILYSFKSLLKLSERVAYFPVYIIYYTEVIAYT